jgi:hypothetical protein
MFWGVGWGEGWGEGEGSGVRGGGRRWWLGGRQGVERKGGSGRVVRGVGARGCLTLCSDPRTKSSSLAMGQLTCERHGRFQGGKGAF